LQLAPETDTDIICLGHAKGEVSFLVRLVDSPLAFLRPGRVGDHQENCKAKRKGAHGGSLVLLAKGIYKLRCRGSAASMKEITS
jgi:hypothetical protein